MPPWFKLRDKLRANEERADKYNSEVEAGFNFLVNAREWFINGTLDDKKSILLSLGSNFTVFNGKLTIKPAKWLNWLFENYKGVEEKYLRIEPAERCINKETDRCLSPVRSLILPVASEFRRRIILEKPRIYSSKVA